MNKRIVEVSWANMAFAVSSIIFMQQASAVDWGDNSIGYRYGTKFAELYNTRIFTKNIINFTHASEY